MQGQPENRLDQPQHQSQIEGLLAVYHDAAGIAQPGVFFAQQIDAEHGAGENAEEYGGGAHEMCQRQNRLDVVFGFEAIEQGADQDDNAIARIAKAEAEKEHEERCEKGRQVQLAVRRQCKKLADRLEVFGETPVFEQYRRLVFGNGVFGPEYNGLIFKYLLQLVFYRAGYKTLQNHDGAVGGIGDGVAEGLFGVGMFQELIAHAV